MSENINIFYIGQDDLIELLATSICSVCDNTSSFVDFYILDCGICGLNKRKLEDLKLQFDNFELNFLKIDLNVFNGLKKYKGFSDFWSKLLIPELTPTLNKAIYLDTDTVILDDIKLLWEQDLENYPLGAVPATYYDKWRDDAFNAVYPKTDKWLFINTGMLLIDCDKWRENSITENILQLCKKYNDVLDVAVGYDEAMVSLYFENNFKVLDCRFNLSDHENHLKEFEPFYNDIYIDNEWENIVIRHYAGSDKPWVCLRNDYDGNILKNYNAFWFYVKMTPFVIGLYQRFKEHLMSSILGNSPNFIKIKNKYKLFNLIPVFYVIETATRIKYKLFKFIPLLTIKKMPHKLKYKLFGFVQILTVRLDEKVKKYKLFGFIQILTKRTKVYDI